MPRINTYVLDDDLHVDDKVIGTDSSGLGTKNFKLAEIATFFGEKGLIALAAQTTYKFVVTERGDGTFSLPALGGNNSAFSSITALKFNKIDNSSQDIANFLQIFPSKKIIISNLSNKNIFGIYKVTSVTVDSGDANYYDFSLSYTQGNGTLEDGKIYSVGMLDADKEYIHDQSVASATWNIAHNLEKFPSVTIALSTGQKGYGDVSYTDNNNLTITFTGAESGKAYLN